MVTGADRRLGSIRLLIKFHWREVTHGFVNAAGVALETHNSKSECDVADFVCRSVGEERVKECK